jgi:AraC-like DNA-binding protein
MPLRFDKPEGILSGFHADAPDPAVPEILHVGEQWATADHPIPRHSHGVWELYFQVAGSSVWCDARGNQFGCRPGALYVPRPGLEHWLERAGDPKHHFLFAALDVDEWVARRLPGLAATWARRDFVYLPESWGIEAPFRMLLREVTGHREFRSEGLTAALDQLLLAVTRAMAEKGPERPATGVHPGVEAARLALERHPSEPWTLADLSRVAGLSSNHLVGRFTRDVGKSPHRYLQELRIARARELLKTTDSSVTEIAHELGFSSSQHFARAFRLACGCSATEFRASCTAR